MFAWGSRNLSMPYPIFGGKFVQQARQGLNRRDMLRSRSVELWAFHDAKTHGNENTGPNRD